jgi:hypothetical protein
MDKLKGFVYSKHFAVGTRSEKELFVLQTKKKGEIIIEYATQTIANYIRKMVEIEGTLKPSGISEPSFLNSSFAIIVSNINFIDDGLIPD